MLPALYIGIDNGSGGGIAALDDLGGVFRVDPMPATDADLLMILEAIEGSCAARRSFAYLEHAQAFPKMGTSSAFNYGRGYGAVQMALIACDIPYDIVVPRKWQAALGCLTGGDKNVSKRRAQQLFPTTVKVTHAIADALLIAEYCRRVRAGYEKQDERQTERRRGPITLSKCVSVEAGEVSANEIRRAAVANAPRDATDPQRAAGFAVRGGRRRAGLDEPHKT